jgi:hypothetical protein
MDAARDCGKLLEMSTPLPNAAPASPSQPSGWLVKLSVVGVFAILTIAVAWRAVVPPAETATEMPPTSFPTLPDATNPVTPTGVWMEAGSDPSAPTWSPNGRFLAFEIPRAFGAVKIQVADISRDVRAVLAALAPEGTSKGEHFRLMQRPVWTDTGALLFEGTLERSAERRLYEANPRQPTAAEAVASAQLPGNLIDGADWRGERLAGAVRGLQDSSLFVFDRRQKRARPVADAPGAEHQPTFSRDGATVWFSRTLKDDDLWRVAISSGKAELVAGGPGDQGRVSTLPGTAVAYFDSTDGRVGQVMLSDAKGRRSVATNVRMPRSGPPAVSPDGHWLFWVDVGVPELLVATSLNSGKTVKIRPGVGAIESPVVGATDGRTRVAFLAGEPGNIGVFAADVTEALVDEPVVSSTAPSPRAN